MADDTLFSLKQDTRNLFYHGFDNYMRHAFPEDELRPISCIPQTRNRENPADIGLNDVLGNYSLTLIDSLSTLAILASDDDVRDGRDALADFKESVQSLTELYGDGTRNDKGRVACGSRACAFDLDSKVQVFETNIRGVGGLLSAHLFAIGELPIRGYEPSWTALDEERKRSVGADEGIAWNENFIYDGQLLRLAYDLALRLLPAFDTATGLPYPRVNLRHGIPFYRDAEAGTCRLDGTSSDPREITETCAAGAGSLILEFATLSRLTGDVRFERLAKRAFWAIWQRRSSIGLIGNGIDAESGQWTMPPLSGIGAGIDSFYEYAVKSHILLSNLPYDPNLAAEDSPLSFLKAWQDAHAAVKRHVYRSPHTEKHSFYGQADLISGAPRYGWIDNLSGYYPGLLTLAGELDEAVESHLLFTALWTRYSALPERWHAVNAFIDPNFKHWAGRPEFIESTWYLYRATQDPWYLHVGEMALRDIRRRCWAKCGWADLGDVISGEQRDRMESFFLGETAKYLFLLFDDKHPLNHMDDAMVFTTEGHPLKIPKQLQRPYNKAAWLASREAERASADSAPSVARATCPAPSGPLPLTISHVANRADLFHASAMAQLHLVPVQAARSSPLLEPSQDHGPGISYSDVRSPTNYTWYPWTLNYQLVPPKGMSASIKSPIVSTLTFPNLNVAAKMDGNGGQQVKDVIPLGALQKTYDGILINSLSNLRLNMVQEPRSLLIDDEGGVVSEMDLGMEYRVHGIGNWALGKDEKVWIGENAVKGLRLEGMGEESALRRVKDLEWVDLVVDVPVMKHEKETVALDGVDESLSTPNGTMDEIWTEISSMISGFFGADDAVIESHNLDREKETGSSSTRSSQQRTQQPSQSLSRTYIPAILPTGLGAAPLPEVIDRHQSTLSGMHLGSLPFPTIFYLDDMLCESRLPQSIARHYNILVLKRGGCSFSDKLANIPSHAPSADALQLVVVLSVPESTSEGEQQRQMQENGGNSNGAANLIRPLLDKPQRTPHGFERRNQIAMVMIDGNDDTVDVFHRVAQGSGSFDGRGKFIENPVKGPAVPSFDGSARPALAVKRRYWFQSMGMTIGNMLMA